MLGLFHALLNNCSPPPCSCLKPFKLTRHAWHYVDITLHCTICACKVVCSCNI